MAGPRGEEGDLGWGRRNGVARAGPPPGPAPSHDDSDPRPALPVGAEGTLWNKLGVRNATVSQRHRLDARTLPGPRGSDFSRVPGQAPEKALASDLPRASRVSKYASETACPRHSSATTHASHAAVLLVVARIQTATTNAPA